MSNTSVLQQPASDGSKKNLGVKVIWQTSASCENRLVTIQILDTSGPTPLTEWWAISLPRHGEGTSILLAQFVEQVDTTPKSSGLVPDKEE